MTDRQLAMENIDMVDNLVYTPLEKRYLKARIAGTVLAYAGLMVHVAWPGLLLTLAASAVLAWCSLYAWIALPAVYMLIPLSRGFLAVRRSRVTLKEDYVAVSDGKFADNCNYIKYSNIEIVRLVSTPFTPYFRRVKLILSTNGSTFTVRSLREQEAVDIYELLLDKCSSGRI